jgi:hypothetical protein
LPEDSNYGIYDATDFGGGLRCLGVRCWLFRRNVVDNHGYFHIRRTHDTLLENCTVRNSDAGISVTPDAQGCLIRGIRLENVRHPLVDRGTDLACMNPAERLSARLSAQGLLPAKLQTDPAWIAAMQKLRSLAGQEIGTSGLAEAAQAAQAELAKAASAALPDGQPWELLQALTGITLEDHCPRGLATILTTGSGGTVEADLAASLPAWSAPLTLVVNCPPLPGWQSSVPKSSHVNAGTGGGFRPTFTIPAGVWGATTVPMTYIATGASWEMRGAGQITLGGRADVNFVGQWMVVGPFAPGEGDSPLFAGRKLGQSPTPFGGQVYPPERRLDVAAECPSPSGKVKWQSVQLAGQALDFSKLYGNPDRGVAYAVAVLRAAKPTPAILSAGDYYNAGVIYLNGEKLGTPLRYGCRALSVMLQAGDNVLLCGRARTGNDWRLQVNVRLAPAAAPGDVTLVPADRLMAVPALRNLRTHAADSEPDR